MISDPVPSLFSELAAGLLAPLNRILKRRDGRTASDKRKCREDSADGADMSFAPVAYEPEERGNVVEGVELPEIEETDVSDGAAESKDVADEDISSAAAQESRSDEETAAATAECFAAAEKRAEEVSVGKPAEPAEKRDSLLDNKPYVKLIEDVFMLSAEVERIMAKSKDDGVKGFAEHIFCRIEDMVERNGALSIGNEKLFDIRRHQPVPVALVPDGARIAQTVRPGWRLEERVMRRAKVRIVSENEKTEEMEDEVRN